MATPATSSEELPNKNILVRMADWFFAPVTKWAFGFIAGVGDHTRLLGQAIRWGIRRPFRGRLFTEQMEFIGVGSVPIIALVGLFSGAVVALQGVFAMRQVQAERFVGGAVGLTLVRELGPVLTSLMITARAGSGMATELGSMRITEQIDALTAFAVNPIQYLIVPRLVAGIIMAPALTMIFNLVGVVGGYLAAVVAEKVDAAQFIYNLEWLVDPSDVFQGLLKSSIFGLTLTLVSTYQGFYAQGGAKGVGIATTRAVVVSSVLILCLDYFLSDVLLLVFK